MTTRPTSPRVAARARPALISCRRSARWRAFSDSTCAARSPSRSASWSACAARRRSTSRVTPVAPTTSSCSPSTTSPTSSSQWTDPSAHTQRWSNRNGRRSSTALAISCDDPLAVVGMQPGLPRVERAGERRAVHAEQLGRVRVPLDSPRRNVPRPAAHARRPHREGEALVEQGFRIFRHGSASFAATNARASQYARNRRPGRHDRRVERIPGSARPGAVDREIVGEAGDVEQPDHGLAWM